MNDKLAYEKNKRRIFMSKYEQAIKLLERLSSDEFQQFTSSEFDDAIYTAIEALEKQIPKPIYEHIETRLIYKVRYDKFRCSECGFTKEFVDGHTTQYEYCPECGQRIDWEEIE